MTRGQGITKQYRAEQQIYAQIYASRPTPAKIIAQEKERQAQEQHFAKGKFGAYAAVHALHTKPIYRPDVAFTTLDIKNPRLTDGEYATFKQVTKLYKHDLAMAERIAYCRMFGKTPVADIVKQRVEPVAIVQPPVRKYAEIHKRKVLPPVANQVLQEKKLVEALPTLPETSIEPQITPLVVPSVVEETFQVPGRIIDVPKPTTVDKATDYQADFEQDDSRVSSLSSVDSDVSIKEVALTNPAVIKTDVSVELGPDSRLTVISIDEKGKPTPMVTSYNANISGLVVEQVKKPRPMAQVAQDVATFLTTARTRSA